jgi:hypothetical protein
VIGSGKLGGVIAFDRQSGEIIWDTPVGEHQNDELTELPMGERIEVYPGIYGGVETPIAYADGVVYFPVVNLPSRLTAKGGDAQDGSEALEDASANTPTGQGTGEPVAIDVASGEIMWSTEVPSEPFAGATVVSGLVVMPTYDGTIRAFNRSNGQEVWTMETPAGVLAWPAVAGDSIVFAAGAGQPPLLFALRLGADGSLPTATPEPTETDTPAETATATTTENGVADGDSCADNDAYADRDGRSN